MSNLFSDIFEAIKFLRQRKGTTEKEIITYVQDHLGRLLTVGAERHALVEVIKAIEELRERKGSTNKQICDFVRNRTRNPNDPMKVLKTIRTLNKLVEEGVVVQRGKRYMFPLKETRLACVDRKHDDDEVETVGLEDDADDEWTFSDDEEGQKDGVKDDTMAAVRARRIAARRCKANKRRVGHGVNNSTASDCNRYGREGKDCRSRSPVKRGKRIEENKPKHRFEQEQDKQRKSGSIEKSESTLADERRPEEHRERENHRERDRERDKDREREREREKEREAKEKEREREMREKERNRDGKYSKCHYRSPPGPHSPNTPGVHVNRKESCCSDFRSKRHTLKIKADYDEEDEDEDAKKNETAETPDKRNYSPRKQERKDTDRPCDRKRNCDKANSCQRDSFTPEDNRSNRSISLCSECAKRKTDNGKSCEEGALSW